VSSDADARPFVLPRDLDFECTSCGRCCRDRWEIRVDGASAERLRAIDWVAHDPSLAGTATFEPRRLPVAQDDLAWTVARRPSGACVFLTEKNLCRIHAELGGAAKPQVCRQFPYLFAETPEGTTVGLSHFCPGVRRVEGAAEPPLAKKLDELRDLRKAGLRVERAPESILASEGLAMPWADYRAVEDLLRELVVDPRVDLATALASLSLAASMLVDFLAVRARGKDAPPAGAGREFVAGWRKIGLERIQAIARRLRPAPRTGRAFLQQYLSLVDLASADAPRSTLGRALAGTAAVGREVLGVGSFRCAPLGASVPVRSVRAVELPWDDAERAAPLRAYADHALFRRRLLPVFGVRTGIGLLVLHASAARHLARASVALEGRSRATTDDVRRGIELVEKHYATHSRLDQALAEGPARSLFQRLHTPRTAAALLSA
jgi:Fe-S-cluster containining protein